MKPGKPIRSDYLWDRSGQPDPQVQRLEQLLDQFRSHRPAPPLPIRHHTPWAAIAAALILTVAGFWLLSDGAPQGWKMARAGRQGTLHVGETLDTGATGHATLNVGTIGYLDVEPHSRLRLERARPGQQRMSLDHGVIHAFITAPARTFIVDTPAAVATDLGCFYTLQVDPDGAGMVSVQAGWVSFTHAGRESFIPSGAACRMRPGHGPGTPFREHASPAFRQALEDYDFAGGGDRALAVVLSEATPDDAFTLWHLLPQPQVYDALAALVPPPQGVTREGILRHDRHMLDRWWDQLGLGNAAWWHQQTRPWK